jgi:heterotetrameric sarcosine oxidase gamma subunit
VARSPISPAAAGPAGAALTLADLSLLAKTLVRAPANGAMAGALVVSFARAARDAEGTLVVGSGPGEWTVIGALGDGQSQRSRLEAVAASHSARELITVIDITHGLALIRLTGKDAPALLATVCAIDLADRRTPDGMAFRTSVAKVITGVIRDDQDGVLSYLLSCERSYGQYLYGALLDAGAEFGVETDGSLGGQGAIIFQIVPGA